MDQNFNWNRFADQPHNVAPKKRRFWYHFRFAPGYFSLLLSNARKAIPVWGRYRRYKKSMYERPSPLHHPFGVCVSPQFENGTKVLECVEELGVKHVLVRIPSWEKERLDDYRKFVADIRDRNADVVIALLQRRADVRDPGNWAQFVDDVFSLFEPLCSLFEVGHAWNRTKWGIWDYREYLKLAAPCFALAKKYQIELIGPAVIDFEFHLYPKVLELAPFDKVSSLLYVDRVGAPENKQFGWDTARKIALLRAVVDACLREKREIWITEMNWPLSGTGKYSPAVGNMNVTEEEQANFLVRYFVLCLSSGFVSRVYWWQLVAPGYGLIDSRPNNWRKRPSFYAYKSMIERLRESTFVQKMPHVHAHIFSFQKREMKFAVCWCRDSSVDVIFSQGVTRAESRDGKEIPVRENKLRVGPAPLYVYFQ